MRTFILTCLSYKMLCIECGIITYVLLSSSSTPPPPLPLLPFLLHQSFLLCFLHLFMSLRRWSSEFFVCFRTEEDELMLFHLLNMHERNPDSGAWPFTPRPPSLMHAAGTWWVSEKSLDRGVLGGGARSSFFFNFAKPLSYHLTLTFSLIVEHKLISPIHAFIIIKNLFDGFRWSF